MRHLAATLAAVALLFSAGSAWADYDDGVAALKRGDYATAFRELLPYAEQGDAPTQFNIGRMYYLGEGVPENYAEAARWYRRVAEQGDTKAQISLGFMYAQGEGVLKNNAEAAKCYRKAAEQGNAIAQFSLGFMYSRGLGVSENDVEALKWYSLAKAQGIENAAKGLDILKKQMTPAQIAEAQELAAEMWEKINN